MNKELNWIDRRRNDRIPQIQTHSTMWKCFALRQQNHHQQANFMKISKKFFQRSKKWNTPFYLQMFCALSGRSLSWNTLVFSRFTPRKHANFTSCHFFHTHVLPHHSKAQLLRYCGTRSFLGVAKSWKATLIRVPWFGRHVENLGDVIIYPVLVVARTGQRKLTSIVACVAGTTRSVNASCSDVITVPLFFWPPSPWSYNPRRAISRQERIKRLSLSRRSHEKIGDCEQSNEIYCFWWRSPEQTFPRFFSTFDIEKLG